MIFQPLLFDNLELKRPVPSPDDLAEIERIIESAGDNAGEWTDRAVAESDFLERI